MTYTHERTPTERHTQSTYSNTNTMFRGTQLQLLLLLLLLLVVVVVVVVVVVGVVQQFYEATRFMHNKSVTVPKTLSHMTFTPVINCGKCFVTRESSVSHETIFRHCFLSSHFLPTQRWPFKTWRNGHTYTAFVSRACIWPDTPGGQRWPRCPHWLTPSLHCVANTYGSVGHPDRQTVGAYRQRVSGRARPQSCPLLSLVTAGVDVFNAQLPRER